MTDLIANGESGLSVRTKINTLSDAVSAIANAANKNYFLGQSGNGTATGQDNTAQGYRAGQTLSTGNNNTMIGSRAGNVVGAGLDNVLVGFLAGYHAVGLNYNVIIGSGAMTAATAAIHSNVAVGKDAAKAYNGNEMVAIGRNALVLATGGPSTAVGTNAGGTTTTGTRQTLFGYNAMGGAAYDDVIAIGHNVAATRSGEIVIGSATQTYLRMFGLSFAHWDATSFNLYLGTDGPTTNATGLNSLGIGRDAANSVSTGSNVIGIGALAAELQSTGSNVIAIGVTAAQNGVSLADCTVTGHKAGRYMTTGTGGTIYGFRASEHNAEAHGQTALGDSAFWHSQGSFCVGIGYVVAEGMSQGTRNELIGMAAARYRDNGDDLVLIGYLAGAITSNAASTNLVSVTNPTDAIGGMTAGHRLVGIGTQALEECLGSDVVAIGYQAGRSLVGTANAALNSIFIGSLAGYHASQKVAPVNQIVIGYGVYATADNAVVIGNTSNDSFTFGATTFTAANLVALKALV